MISYECLYENTSSIGHDFDFGLCLEREFMQDFDDVSHPFIIPFFLKLDP